MVLPDLRKAMPRRERFQGKANNNKNNNNNNNNNNRRKKN
jgi:hypothetical protein